MHGFCFVSLFHVYRRHLVVLHNCSAFWYMGSHFTVQKSPTLNIVMKKIVMIDQYVKRSQPVESMCSRQFPSFKYIGAQSCKRAAHTTYQWSSAVLQIPLPLVILKSSGTSLRLGKVRHTGRVILNPIATYLQQAASFFKPFLKRPCRRLSSKTPQLLYWHTHAL